MPSPFYMEDIFLWEDLKEDVPKDNNVWNVIK